jgi:hypothetical protein
MDSFRTDDTAAIDRLMVEPTALYAWSIIWRRGNTSPALRRFVDVVRAVGAQRGWMRPARAADICMPTEDRATVAIIDS